MMSRQACCTALFVAACLAAAPPATAETARQGRCSDHQEMTSRLAERYGESRHAVALAQDNAVIEIFAADETGTWTITMTRPGGQTCMIAAGVAFEELKEALPNTDPQA
ncbi:hypothetical protein [Pseudoroseicyclus aestuarii]|uniref:YpeB-like protein with protease inhibitory function n=1 Tax=Pseudoroseicyclus aestuarii TaxID=1795041 RepID=A0A318T3H4_9RHOB|nr:hypothetical protein [Pseudoroseicyclus aestuarii]PYE84754.1 hypothetical protein DFP88_102557 [Pseudoroseicyclus aestuarii]